MPNVTRDQLRAALADLASGGTADAVAERLQVGGTVGDPADCDACPIALWLSERLGVRCGAGYSIAWVDGTDITAPMPRAAALFINRFDVVRAYPDLIGDPAPLLAAVKGGA